MVVLENGLKNKPMMPISTVADQLQVHQRTLRIYDEAGILTPQRSGKNRRLYSYSDLQRGKLIQYLTRDLGINLNGVKIILEFAKDIPNDLTLEQIVEIAKNAGITKEMQAENRANSLRRGRPIRIGG